MVTHTLVYKRSINFFNILRRNIITFISWTINITIGLLYVTLDILCCLFLETSYNRKWGSIRGFNIRYWRFRFWYLFL